MPNDAAADTANNPNAEMLPWINGSTLSNYTKTYHNASALLPWISRPSLSPAVLHDNSIGLLSGITRSKLPTAIQT